MLFHYSTCRILNQIFSQFISGLMVSFIFLGMLMLVYGCWVLISWIKVLNFLISKVLLLNFADEIRARVGFLGLGIMGSPMAQNLIKAGYDLNCLIVKN